ncbi:MAG: glycosyltransferase family 4 protein [Planctomycetes bacterium]|nr:glycosyltransferase family 4 protein [Planctomycetota bacterium]
MSFKPSLRGAARTALGITSTATVVGWIGRMSKEKAPDVLLRAIKCLGQSEIETLLIGDGREMGPTAQLASDLGLCSRVHFAGAVPEASKLMKAFDVFVISSHTEGLPMVLLEAMGAGVPVVATAVGEIPEVLDRGRLGILTPPGEPERLADAMRGVLRDLSGAAERAARAQQHVADHYAIDSWVDQILRAYQAALPSKPLRPTDRGRGPS